MRRVVSAFEGCYEAPRAAALAGVPVSTVYDWARKGVVVPSVSKTKPMYWSYADLMALRVVYWLRHPKPGIYVLVQSEGEQDRIPDSPEHGQQVKVPASPMKAVRRALLELEDHGIDIWSTDEHGAHTSPLLVDRTGSIHLNEPPRVQTLDGQGVMTDLLDLLGPFDADGTSGPDLRRPRPHLRIVPGKVSGEPHLEHSRLTTQTVVALCDRGFTFDQIRRLYPNESPAGLREAIDLEHGLAA